MTLLIEPSGFEVNGATVNGSQELIDYINAIKFSTPRFFPPLIFANAAGGDDGSGLSDIFCIHATTDTFYIEADRPPFKIPRGKRKC
jgi:hypothetical protein